MSAKSTTTRLAHGAFGLALMTFLGPGFHATSSPQAPRGQVAFEAGLLGLVIAAGAITLALVSLKRFGHEASRAGIGWARSALAIAGVAVVVWTAALAMQIRA